MTRLLPVCLSLFLCASLIGCNSIPSQEAIDIKQLREEIYDIKIALGMRCRSRGIFPCQDYSERIESLEKQNGLFWVEDEDVNPIKAHHKRIIK